MSVHLPYGLDFERDFFIDNFKIASRVYGTFALAVMHPGMIYLYLRHSPHLQQELKIGCIVHQASMALGDLYLCFIYNCYTLLPIPSLVCNGLACSLLVPPATFLAVEGFILVTVGGAFYLILIAIHQSVLAEDDRLKLSRRNQYIAAAIIYALMLPNPFTIAVYGGGSVNSSLLLTSPRLNWTRVFPSTIVYGTEGQVEQLKSAMIWMAITLAIVSPIVPFTMIHAIWILHKRFNAAVTSRAQQARIRANRVFIAQMSYSLVAFITPLILVFTFLSFPPPDWLPDSACLVIRVTTSIVFTMHPLIGTTISFVKTSSYRETLTVAFRYATCRKSTITHVKVSDFSTTAVN